MRDFPVGWLLSILIMRYCRRDVPKESKGYRQYSMSGGPFMVVPRLDTFFSDSNDSSIDRKPSMNSSLNVISGNVSLKKI